jgi:hypothetical protein
MLTKSPKAERMKYNILNYHFTCFHRCSEWKWGICKHCRSRHRCKDHVRPVYPSEEGISYPTEEVEISLAHSQDLGTYVHEFTETTVIQIMNRWRKYWYAGVQFKGYGDTYIAHFICPYGTNNGRCLEPVTKRNRPRW